MAISLKTYSSSALHAKTASNGANKFFATDVSEEACTVVRAANEGRVECGACVVNIVNREVLSTMAHM